MSVPADSLSKSGRREDAEPVSPACLDDLFAALRDRRRLLVAVSGGADSMALLHLLKAWRDARGDERPELHVATVDHGLRPGSADEAAWVAARSADMGLPHRTLLWRGDKPATGVQAAARAARYRLLVEAARDAACDAIVLAHTSDDQAETVLMRLARGSGVDGLSGMRATAALDDILLVRPLLGIAKDRLVATLRARGANWREDPSNTDPRFERVRLRDMQPDLEGLGITPAALARTARRLGRARAALDAWTTRAMREIVDPHHGAVATIGKAAFADLPEEIGVRLLQRIIWAFGGEAQPPRLTRLEHLFDDLRAGSIGMTLGGCAVASEPDRLIVIREAGRQGLPSVTIVPGVPVRWDRRFVVELAAAPGAPVCRGLEVRPLGRAGLNQFFPLVETGRITLQSAPGPFLALSDGKFASSPLARRAWQTLPSIWHREVLVAVPHIGTGIVDTRMALPWQDACRFRFETGQRL